MKTKILSLLRRNHRNTHLLESLYPEELKEFQRYSKSELKALQRLYAIAQDIVARAIPGDFVECGVWNGGSAASISYGLQGSDKKIWLYDSFAGMPQVKDVDGPVAKKYVGKVVGHESQVHEVLSLAGVSTADYVIKKGWFEDTFKEDLPKSISLLHIDADWYDSVSLCLETLYDLVADGGVVVLDDFGCWEGCREAFYDFICRRNLKPVLERHGYSAAFWVKERTNNREFESQWLIP